MNELMTLVREVCGSLAVVVIVVQGWANWIQYKRNGELRDKMLEMAQAIVKWAIKARVRAIERYFEQLEKDTKTQQ